MFWSGSVSLGHHCAMKYMTGTAYLVRGTTSSGAVQGPVENKCFCGKFAAVSCGISQTGVQNVEN